MAGAVRVALLLFAMAGLFIGILGVWSGMRGIRDDEILPDTATLVVSVVGLLAGMIASASLFGGFMRRGWQVPIAMPIAGAVLALAGFVVACYVLVQARKVFVVPTPYVPDYFDVGHAGSSKSVPIRLSVVPYVALAGFVAAMIAFVWQTIAIARRRDPVVAYEEAIARGDVPKL